MDVIETKRTYLKPASIDDAPFQLKLMTSPGWLENIGDRGVHSVADAEKYIRERMLPQYERLGFGSYTVFHKELNIPIGNCGLYDRKGLEGVDIGFAFLPDFMRMGYAYEAASKLLNYAFNEFKIDLIKAITIPSNIPSQRLLEKLGLKFSKYFHLEDDPEELMLYSLDINQYQNRST